MQPEKPHFHVTAEQDFWILVATGKRTASSWGAGRSPQRLPLSWNSSLISKVYSLRHRFPLSSHCRGKGSSRGGRSLVSLIAGSSPISGLVFEWVRVSVRVAREGGTFPYDCKTPKKRQISKRGASSSRWGLVRAVIPIFLHCLIMGTEVPRPHGENNTQRVPCWVVREDVPRWRWSNRARRRPAPTVGDVIT